MKRLMVILAVLWTAACSQPTAGDRPEAVRIRFATDWRAQAEHGGFYQALATGEYARRGLDVTIIQGGPAVNVPQLLATDSVEMGMGSNSFIVMNLAREGAPVKAVAAIFQKDPQVLMAHPAQGIASIADMKGRPFLLSDASLTSFWLWLKAKYGFTDDQAVGNPSKGLFLENERAIMQGYITAEPWILKKEASFNPVVFLLADDGYPGYAAMILATDKLIEERPEAVRAFVDATIEGWKTYLHGDPRPADQMILRENPDMTQAQLDNARAMMKTYGLVQSGDAQATDIGAMTEARWRLFFETAASQGVYPPDMDWRDAFTLQFVTPQP